jgi:hypothetical protein
MLNPYGGPAPPAWADLAHSAMLLVTRTVSSGSNGPPSAPAWNRLRRPEKRSPALILSSQPPNLEKTVHTDADAMIGVISGRRGSASGPVGFDGTLSEVMTYG